MPAVNDRTLVATILEARVAPENAARLKAVYSASIEHLDEGIVETFLLSAPDNSPLWRILTIWKDREALQAMRSSGQPPRGILIFKEVHAEPVLSVLDVAAHAGSLPSS